MEVQVVKEVPTVAVIQPLVPVLKADTSRDRVPFVYDYQRGKAIFPSKREKLLVETWCRSWNYAECVRVLKEELNCSISPMTAMRWLKRSHVVEWKDDILKKKALSNGYTRDKWMADGIGMQDGAKKEFSQLVAWKEMGKACGFYESNALINNNIQINFTEKS